MRPLLLHLRGARRVHVLGRHLLHAHTVEDQSGHRGSVLYVSGQREGATAHREVVSLKNGLEIAELDTIETKGRLDPRVWFSEKVRAAVEPELPIIEDHAVRVDIGRIDAVAGLRVSDVFRGHIDAAQLQWPEGAGIDVRERAILYLEPVDLEVQRHRLEGLLPATVFQGHVAPGLRTEVLEVDVQLRSIKGHLRYDLAAEESPPIDGRRQRMDPCHGRVGIGVLSNRRIHQLERHRPGVYVKGTHTHGIAREPAVDLMLHVAARWLVNEEGGQGGNDDEPRKDSDQQGPPSTS